MTTAGLEFQLLLLLFMLVNAALAAMLLQLQLQPPAALVASRVKACLVLLQCWSNATPLGKCNSGANAKRLCTSQPTPQIAAM